jgi:GNAT superfamily N-acetyltransferase
MITFQAESLEAVLPELKPLLPLHYLELAMDQDDVPLDPNYDRYIELEKAKVLSFFTCRKDGELIGYIIGFVLGHMHYQSTLHFTADIYYLMQEHRNTGIGFRFFKEHEQLLRKLGVVRSVFGTKNHQDHSKLFSALGYHDQDQILSKIL